MSALRRATATVALSPVHCCRALFTWMATPAGTVDRVSPTCFLKVNGHTVQIHR